LAPFNNETKHDAESLVSKKIDGPVNETLNPAIVGADTTILVKSDEFEAVNVTAAIVFVPNKISATAVIVPGVVVTVDN